MHYLKKIIQAELSQCDEAASFLQSAFWGNFKARFGWTARAFLAGWEENGAPKGEMPEPETPEGGGAPLLVISRRLAPGISFAYVPWGPELPNKAEGITGFPANDKARTAALAELARALKNFLPSNTAFIRFDPPWYTESAESAAPFIGNPFKRAAADIQPPDTVLIDLAQSSETILLSMKNKWRYNIGLAEKRGVTVRRADMDGLDTFYALLSETAKRDGIAVHGIDYYQNLFKLSQEYKNPEKTAAVIPELRLYLAEHEGDVLAGIVVLIRGKDEVYLYGASSDHKRNLMAPYALQWKAMNDAIEAGCTQYDLFGIPPNDDPNHPMAGLYRFKTGFGGKIIHRPGSWDYAYKPMVMKLFNIAEKLRKKLRDRKKRRKSAD
jgi:lipid II:glycine glycyltransferase (peptidoglycan interpeptide bridge formation enzyme)